MLRVLVVEDDPAVASLVRMLLEEAGYAATITVDIEGAQDVLRGEPPDIAIVDLGLPRGDSGWDLIERMRTADRFKDLPIVILTAEPPDAVVDRAAELGCEYLGKPFSGAALIDRVQMAVRSTGRTAAQRPVPVVLLLAGYRVEGTIHVPEELRRFSDAWEAVIRDTRDYVPVTEARVTTGSDVAEVDFVQVRKSDVLAAYARDAVR